MNLLKKFTPDALLLAGAASVSYGAWAIYPPAGFIVAGGMAIYVGMRLA